VERRRGEERRGGSSNSIVQGKVVHESRHLEQVVPLCASPQSAACRARERFEAASDRRAESTQ
jgi:hypothetical protein